MANDGVLSLSKERAPAITLGPETSALVAALGAVEARLREVESRLAPINRAVLQDVAVAAGVDVFNTAIAPTRPPSIFRACVAFSAMGVLSMVFVRNGNAQVCDLNAGVALQPGSLYMFDVGVDGGDAVNYRFSANATMLTLRLQEV